MRGDSVERARSIAALTGRTTYDIIDQAVTIGLRRRMEEAEDLRLRSKLREAEDLLRMELWGHERPRPDIPDRVHQPYAPCKVTRADGTTYIANPRAERRRSSAPKPAVRPKADVLEQAERPSPGVVVLGTEQARSLGLGSMAWLANE